MTDDIPDWMKKLYTLPIGTVLYGHCGGAFGRDSYEAKMVEAVGADWIVVREIESRQVLLATDRRWGNPNDNIHEFLGKYTIPEDDNDY